MEEGKVEVSATPKIEGETDETEDGYEKDRARFEEIK